MNVTVNMKIKGDKNWELETIAVKESRLLTRCVHRMKGETALQRERSCGNTDRENEFRMKHLIKRLQILRERIQNDTPEVRD